METIKVKTEIIDTFLEKNNLKPRDLARYLDQEHDFSCYKDTQYDD